MAPHEQDLLGMVLTLLVPMVSGAAISAWLLRKYFSLTLIIVSFVISIIFIFVMYSAAQTQSVPLILVVGFLFGAAIGADLGGFTLVVTARLKNPERAMEAVGITLGTVAISTFVAAGIGLFSGYNFQGWGGLLMGGLIMLIIIGLVSLAFQFNRVIELAIGVVSSIFWVLFLIYDFNRIVENYEDASWSAAADIAMNIFLDMVNLFIRLLPIIVEILNAID